MSVITIYGPPQVEHPRLATCLYQQICTEYIILIDCSTSRLVKLYFRYTTTRCIHTQYKDKASFRNVWMKQSHKEKKLQIKIAKYNQ
jgi:hypothetical protein